MQKGSVTQGILLAFRPTPEVCIHRSYSPSELPRTSHTLHRANNTLDPRKLSRILANGTLDFFAILVPPDTIFL
jgi:hypothetical protein